jgi:predicted phage terminase large subunit-like protein
MVYLSGSGLMLKQEVKPKQLEDYIREVDYHAMNTLYRPSIEAIQFVNFIKMVNGAKGEENKTPVMHLVMIDELIHSQDDNLFVVHRGGAKTTVLHEYAFLYIACYGEFFGFGEVSVAIYVSDTMENGVKSMREQLEFRWRDSEFLQSFIPTTRFTDSRWEFTNIDGHKFFVRGFGATTGVRGFKKYGQRPTWCGFDDLMSDKNAKSPTILADIEDVVYGAAMEALHPSRRKITWTGTPFSKADSLYKAAGSGAWNVKAFPLCEKFPCTKEEYRGSWEDRFTYESTLINYNKKMRAGKVSTFNQEHMLRVVSEEDRLILDCDLRWFSREDVTRNIHLYNIYITSDFATAETESSDYSVISVWALNNKGMWFLIDGICRRQLMDKNIDDLFRLAQEYLPQSVGVEVSGQQNGFIAWIEREMLLRNQWFSLASEGNKGIAGIRPVSKKLVRFQTVQPWFKAGRMYFPTEWRGKHELIIEAEDELVNVSLEGFKSRHDDWSDTCSMLSVMPTWAPSAESFKMKKSDQGLWEMDMELDLEESALSSYIV